MSESTIILYILELVLGGIAAFFAILLWSKTRDAAWMAFIAGIVTSYAKTVYQLLVELGIIYISNSNIIDFFNIPLTTILFSVIPPLFFITGFVLMLLRTRR